MRDRMRATPRITWLILSLGFLCHNVCSNDPSETPKPTTTTAATTTVPTTTAAAAAAATAATTTAPTTTTPTTSASTASISKATTAATSVPTKATTLSVSTNQKTSPIHTITTVTSKQAEATTVKQPVTEHATESMIAKGSSPKATSSASTAVITDSSKSMASTVMPTSSNSAGSTAVTEPLQISTKVTTTGTDTIYAPVQTSKAAAVTVTPATTQENNQKGPTESSEPMKGHSALTTVETAITGVSSSSLSRTTQAPTTRTPDLTKKTATVTSVPSSTTTLPQLQVFLYSQNIKEEPKDKTLGGVCKRLMVNFADGNCTLKYGHRNGTLKIYSVETSGKVNASIAQQYYDELNTNPKDNKTLIAILASCVALLIMIVILAACASHHRKPYNENQQHLTEELQTVENGYHDNPTLEVMEVQSEMQEKKVVLNGEFNDSWIVPFDNLLKEEMPDEEDTHL